MTMSWRDRMSGLGALGALLGLVVGVPAFLAFAFGQPWPHGLPTFDDLTSPTLTDDVILRGLALVLWASWVWLVGSLALELRAQIFAGRRDLPTTARGRLMYRLVASVMLLLPVSQQSTPTVAYAATQPTAVAQVGPTGEKLVDAVHRSVRTVQGDTLWDIAERELGDGLRWRDLLEANPHLPQNQRELPVGVEIVVPANAGSSTAYVVAPGDTLASIAADQLGDASRVSELFELNRGTTHNGKKLRDPDLIWPGMTLRMPEAANVEPTPEVATENVTSPPVTVPTPSAPSIPPELALSDEDGPEQAVTSTTAVAPPVVERAPAPSRADETGVPSTAIDQSVALGAAGVAAAGVLGWLAWTRRRQLQTFRPGLRLPGPSERAVTAEAKIRSIADEQAMEWADAALRILGADLRAASHNMPRIERMCVGTYGVEFVLSSPSPDAPDHFDAVDGGTVWRLKADVELTDPAVTDGFAPLSALLVLGSTREGVQLLNLDEVKALGVSGPDELVEAFLYGTAVSLATAPWAHRDHVTLNEVLASGLGDDVACMPNIVAVPAGDLALESLRAEAATRVAAATAHGWSEAMAARLLDETDCWATRVVVSGTELPFNEQAFEEIRDRRVPAAVVAVGQPDDTAWTLSLRPDGSAWLMPLGLELYGACVLTVDEQRGVAEVLETASEPLVAEETVVDLRPVSAEAARDVDVDALLANTGEVGIRVLGDVETFGFRASDRAAANTAVLARIALHGHIAGGAPSFQALRQDVWATETLTKEVRIDSVRSACSHVRKSLGSASDGTPFLPPGELSLHSEFWCDLDHFDELVEAADWVASNDALRLLEAAVALVRGAPFADVEAHPRYAWLHKHYLLSTISTRIIGAVCKLAELAEDAGDDDLVRRAVRQGLKVEPGNHQLHVHLMRAAAKDQAELERVWSDYQKFCEATGQELQPETLAIYRDIKEAMRHSARFAAQASNS